MQLDLPVVLVGAGLPQLPGLTSDANSYAERLFEFPRIGSLAKDDAEVVLVLPAEKQGVSFVRKALAELLDHTQGYPYFLQEWGYHVWNAAHGSQIDIAAQLGVKVESVAPRRSGLIRKGMIYSPAHGDAAFTVPLFDEFLRRAIPIAE